MINNSGFFWDYRFRACPAPGTYPGGSRDPAYLCDEFGSILAWPGDIVLMVA